MRLVQRVADASVWPMLTGGCRTARDPLHAIAQAGFDVQSVRRLRFPEFKLPVRSAPHVLGTAQRPRHRTTRSIECPAGTREPWLGAVDASASAAHSARPSLCAQPCWGRWWRCNSPLVSQGVLDVGAEDLWQGRSVDGDVRFDRSVSDALLGVLDGGTGPR